MSFQNWKVTNVTWEQGFEYHEISYSVVTTGLENGRAIQDMVHVIADVNTLDVRYMSILAVVNRG